MRDESTVNEKQHDRAHVISKNVYRYPNVLHMAIESEGLLRLYGANYYILSETTDAVRRVGGRSSQSV